MKKKQIPTKEVVIRHMKGGVVAFKFTKADGELREMKGTLQSALIDELSHKETSPNPRTNPEDLVVCWDVEKKSWRSFKLSTLVEYSGLTG